MKLLLTWILFFSFLSDNHPTKKDVLLTITKKYLPDNFTVLENCDEASIDMWAEGDSLQDYIFRYPTIIHESFHIFESVLNFYPDTFRRYRLDDTTTIAVKRFASFPSKQLNAIVPLSLQKQIIRYSLYIDSEEPLTGTQTDGFLGLLEEYAAYYQGLKAVTASYYYLRDTFGWTKPGIWVNYLNNGGSEIYSINEFKLFFSWYLQYSKANRPDIYKKITTDKNIKSLYTKIEKNSKKLIYLYLNHRSEILTKIRPFTESFDGSVRLKGIYGASEIIHKYEYGMDTMIRYLHFTDKLLKDPKNKILDQLRK